MRIAFGLQNNANCIKTEGIVSVGMYMERLQVTWFTLNTERSVFCCVRRGVEAMSVDHICNSWTRCLTSYRGENVADVRRRLKSPNKSK